ncbi:NUDIX hydrolase [[Eubacterium] tenue]|nr:NUDIX hydrolase [[Eubacterium] tenue]MBC8631875.1 NUDIX hydrolase [[Eubacterium] tenue]
MKDKWLIWAKKLQAIAQSGINYSKDKYDIERFEQIRDLSAEIMSEYTYVNTAKIKDLFCNEKGYQTPKVDVRCAIFKENKILLVKESIDKCWSLPGGWADVHLSLKENAIKEAKEEAGVNIIPKRVIAIQDASKNNERLSPYGIYKIFLLCDLIDGSFKENIETEESKFFDIYNLPELSLNRNNKKQIQMCFKAFNDNSFDTIFD